MPLLVWALARADAPAATAASPPKRPAMVFSRALMASGASMSMAWSMTQSWSFSGRISRSAEANMRLKPKSGPFAP